MRFFAVSCLFWFGVLTSLYSCSTSKQTSVKSAKAELVKKVIVQSGFEAPSIVDYSIDSAKVTKDSILTIYVKYQGGCNGLHFELFNDGNIMKSMPPKTNLVLVHRTELENCKEEKVCSLDFNLSPLIYMVPENNKLILRLANWKGRLELQK
jgi:hypothetical protein